jgi:hypothetical protein
VRACGDGDDAMCVLIVNVCDFVGSESAVTMGAGRVFLVFAAVKVGSGRRRCRMVPSTNVPCVGSLAAKGTSGRQVSVMNRWYVVGRRRVICCVCELSPIR